VKREPRVRYHEPGNVFPKGARKVGTKDQSSASDRGREPYRPSEDQLHQLLEKVSLIALTLDVEGRLSFCNDHFLEVTGWQRHEVESRDWFDIFLPKEEREQVREVFQATVRAGDFPAHYENPIITRTGELRLIRWNNAALRDLSGNVIGSASIGEDITERSRQIEALTESEARFRMIFDAATDIMIIHDLEGRFRAVNQEAVRRLGFTLDELLRMTPASIDAPEYAAQVPQRLTDLAATGRLVFETEHVTRDGRRIPTEVSAQQVTYDGQPAILVIGRDITERKRVALELLRSRFELEVLNRVATAFLIHDDDAAYNAVLKVLLEVFDGCAVVLGRMTQGEDLVVVARWLGGMPARMITLDLDRHPWSSVVEAEGAVVIDLARLPDEDAPWMESLIAAPVRDRKVLIGILAVGFGDAEVTADARALLDAVARGAAPILTSRLARDRAEYERVGLHQQLLQSQKMESIGHLAGGVAHDFNNLLQAVFNHVDLAEGDTAAGDDLQRHLEGIRVAAERAASLTNQLLAFSRQQVLQTRAVGLDDLVESLLKLFRRVIGEHIELRFEPGAGEYTIHVDRGQIEQVVLNLVVNARDALPEGGRLTLRTAAVDPDADTRRRLGLEPDARYLMLSVEDTGIGMEETTLKQIFDPFFTTKKWGQGTGLGLATAYGIVSQHGGAIDVSSVPGQGSRFDVLLNIAETASLDPKGCDVRRSEPEGGRETILVAEDEPWVRDLLVETLQRAGYTVVSAEDGEQAVRSFEAREGRFDLVLLDVVMPRVGGRDAWRRMQRIRDDVPVVFSTGYGADAMPEGLGLGEDPNLLHKPYRYTDLLRKVREILDS